jgi:hypothetical protein
MALRHDDSDGSCVSYDDGAGGLVTTPFSAMLWVRHYTGGGDPGGSGTVLGVWGASGTRAWRLSVSDAPLEYRSRYSDDGDNQNSVSSSTTISLDVWHHVGIDFDGTDIRFWLNGILDASANQAGSMFNPTQDLGVGGFADGGNECDIDTEDVRVYNRILTAAEWQTIHASQGKDGIVDGLLARMPQTDREPGILVSAKNSVDVGPSKFLFDTAFGSPVAEYNEGTGFGMR